MLGRIAAMAALTTLLVLGSTTAQAAGPREPVLEAARFKIGDGARTTLESHLARAPAITRRLARIAAPRLTFRIARSSTNRAHGIPMADGTSRYVVELAPEALKESARGRFVFLHELGHVVDWAFVDDDLRARFAAGFAASTAFRPCFAYRGGCVAEGELFADQFAFWAGARRTLRSPYRVPPLLSRRAFGELMAAAGWSDRSPLRVG